MTAMTMTAAALALAIGVAMGLLRGGGSLLLVPALTCLMGFDAKQAVTTGLPVVGITAAVGTVAAASAFVGYGCTVTPDWSFVFPIAAIAAAGTVAGGIAGHTVSQQRLQQVFAAGADCRCGIHSHSRLNRRPT